MSGRRIASSVFLLVLTLSHSTWASSDSLFGHGPKDESLAQSDIADPEPVAAAHVSPAWVTTPGARFQIGWGRAWNRMAINGDKAPVNDISGTDLSLQWGVKLNSDMAIGAGLAVHLPDEGLMRLRFRTVSEPLLPQYDVTPHRVTSDLAVGFAYKGFSLGAGMALSASVGGHGASIGIDQDARGVRSGASADVDISLKPAPIVGLAWQSKWGALAARYRGAEKIPVDIDTIVDVRLPDNPIAGSSLIRLSGANAYEASTLDLGVRLGPWYNTKLLFAVQYARWSDSPNPFASLSINTTIPGTPPEPVAAFSAPKPKDTFSPKVGIELDPVKSLVFIRLGYAYVPTPYPKPSNFVTVLDTSRHVFSTGVKAIVGEAFGVKFSTDAVISSHQLVRESGTKSDPSLPFTRYSLDGSLLRGAIALQGEFL